MSVYEEKSYMCDDRGKTFARPDALKSHSLEHSKDKPYKCDDCGKSFTLLRMLNQHRLNHVEENSRLNNCAKLSPEPGRLKKSRLNRVYVKGKPHKCDDKFTELQDLEEHKVLQSGDNLHGSDESENEKIQGASESDSEGFSCSEDDTESKPKASFPHKCSDCVKSFSTEMGLKMHRLTHSKQSFKCRDCVKLFSTLKSLRSHRLVHSSNRPYKCDECDKSFMSERNLKSHEYVHNGKKPHKCGDCGKSFCTPCSLNRHQRIHFKDKPYKCDECGKSFTLPYTLEIHKLFHSGHKPHKCNECGKSYTLARQLKSHQLSVHRNIKRFKCSKCSYVTFFRSRLKIHFQGHIEKSFECDKCGNMYARLNSLNRHKLIHSGEKPHKCYECNRSFYVSEKLRQHVLRVHKNSRKLQCSMCGFVTFFKNQLKSHLIEHNLEKSKKSDNFDEPLNKTAGRFKQNKQSGSGNKLYECDICGQSFNQLEELKVHRIILCGGHDVENTDEIKSEIKDSVSEFQYHYGTKSEEDEADYRESCSDQCSSQSNQGDELAQEEQSLQTSKDNPSIKVSDEPLEPDHNLETDESCPSEDPDFDWDLLHHPSPTNFPPAFTGKVQQLAAALLAMVPTLTSRDQQEAEFALSMAVNYPNMADRERNVLYQRLNLLYLAAYYGWPHAISTSEAYTKNS